MNKADTIAKFSRAIHNVGFQLKKYSPEIMAIAGVVGMVTSAVMACKATTKASEIIDETKESVSMIHDLVADQAIPESKYSEEDSKRDLVIVYSKAVMKFAKLYGPSLIIAGLSAGSILSSTTILRKRNIAIGTAYTALDRSFRTYRDRVIEKFGEDLDKELKYGTTTKVIEEITVDENGNEMNSRAESPAGNYVLMSMVKNKSCPPTRRTGFYTLNYEFGIDYLKDLVEVAMKYGIIDKSGAWFSIIDTETGELKAKLQGMSNVYKHLEDPENESTLTMIENYVDKQMSMK